MRISFNYPGRFGNNLFQYLIAKIFQRIYRCELCYDKKNGIRIDDNKFIKYENDYKKLYELNKNNISTEDEWFDLFKIEELDGKDLIFDGFFQRFFMFNVFKNYIRTLIHPSNHEYINSTIRVSDIANMSMIKINRPSNEIVMHIRLDDYCGSGFNSNIVSYEYYENFILKYPNHHITIICDVLRTDNENKYFSHLIKYPNVFLHQKSLLEDFTYLMNSEFVISSNSTFAYTALLIGKAKKAFFPKNNAHINQEITNIKDVECSFEDCKYINLITMKIL